MTHVHDIHLFDCSFNVGQDANFHYGDVINYNAQSVHFTPSQFQSGSPCSQHYHLSSINAQINLKAEPFPSAFSQLLALGASCNAEERRPHPRCHPGTHLETLDAVNTWMASGEPRICWLHGPAGAGKSAITQTISETYAAAA